MKGPRNESKGKGNKYPRSSSNSKKPQRRGGRGKVEPPKDGEELTTDRKHTNDPAWYVDGTLSNDVASLFFSKPNGLPFELVPPSTSTALSLTSDQYDWSTAGICALDVAPAFGPNAGQNAPINIAAQAMYAFIRSKNSGARNWDANDGMTYVLAIAEAFSAIMAAERVYGFARRFIAQNKYFPEPLAKALNVDYNDIQGNYLQLAAGINLVIAKMGAFAVPNNMSYFQRKVFMFRDVYLDSDNPKDQIYAFVPTGFYKYTIDNLRPEAYLKYKAWPANATVSQIITYLNDLIDTLWTSEDAAIICGDIIKAYGENIIQLMMMPQEFVAMPVVMDDYLRYQIRNATIVNEFAVTDLHQDTTKAYLEYNPEVFAAGASSFYTNWAAANCWLLAGPSILTSNNANPTVDEVMESTRFKCMTRNPGLESDGAHAELICGTEVLVNMRTYVYWHNRTYDTIGFDANGVGLMQFLSTHRNYSGPYCARLAQFRWHPMFYCWNKDISDRSTSFSGVINELDSIVTINADNLYNMHEVALMKMIASPSISLL